MEFNEALRKVRKMRELTQKDVYTQLNVSPNCYASWEQGRTQPDIETIKKLASLFKVTSDVLLGLSEEVENTSGNSSNQNK